MPDTPKSDTPPSDTPTANQQQPFAATPPPSEIDEDRVDDAQVDQTGVATADPDPADLSMYDRLARERPLRLLAVGYAGYMLLTFVLLALPFSHGTVPDDATALDHLFMAVSAVSTTGLITLDTPNAYNLVGQVVLVLAFQAGGLGYMTLGSFMALTTRRQLSPGRASIAAVAFTLPEGFEVRTFLKHVVVFAAAVETLGVIGFYFAFRDAGVESPLWPAIFHSVSGFCTAGFSLFSDSLEGFRGHFWVNAVASFVSLAGAIGFLVASDLYLTLIGRRPRMTLTSKIVLRLTAIAIAAGWILLLLTDPGLRELPPVERIQTAGFQAMTALTTVGFNTYPFGELSSAALLVTVVMMVLGASPSGTGGGLKTTSLSAALAVTASVLRGDGRVCYRGTEVPAHRVHQAFAAIVFYLLFALVGSTLLLLTETGPPLPIIFEAASALGTVGISTGVTGTLTTLGKWVIIGLMFAGRLGPLTVGLALLAAHGPHPDRDDLAI